MRKLLLATLLLVSCCIVAYSQESACGDGVDNDNDGFVDCFDGDCRANPTCKDFYIGQDKLCQVPPTGPATFKMKLESSSPDRMTYSSGKMVVGDLDADGIPEVVSVHPDDKKVYILNGQNLAIKYTGNTTGTPEYFDHAIADIKGDGCADIFIAEKVGSKFYITSFNCQGVQQWTTQAYDEPITLGIADFGADGKPEVYYRNEILEDRKSVV